MKKKYVAVMVGVGAAMAIGAPMAMAAELPGLPELPGQSAPAGEPNGADCSFTPGEAETSSNTPALTLPSITEGIPNSGNCESFGNGQNNGQFSGQDRVDPPASEEPPVENPDLPGGDAPSTALPIPS